MRIENIRLKNYRAFQNVTVENIPGFCVIVGANGTGKTTFFDVFNFLQEALQQNVTKALSRRGGFSETVSRGQKGPIEIEVKFRSEDGRLGTFFLQINVQGQRPVVSREILRFRRGQSGSPWHILDFSLGKGKAVVNVDDENIAYVDMKRDEFTLDAPDILALKGLGQFSKFRLASEFRAILESWHVSDLHIQSTRDRQEDGLAEHLSKVGDNLYQVARYLYENEPALFESIKAKMLSRVPGVASIDVTPTPDGYLLLRFGDGAFQNPFLAKHVSDGTLRMFAYLVLLNAPKPVPLLAVEEPENQLYPKLMAVLAEEFRLYAARGGQVFISTHSPDFLDAVKLDEVFWLSKIGGYTTVHRAADDPQLKCFMDEGDLMGHLWNMGLFEGADPT
ncbi:MAG: AAA family ATPase [Deltaproteobacteria bacterium]|jgi:predicted ATPase|nr:AAA family ATPase [Deltaproteobacteria bacterium]